MPKALVRLRKLSNELFLRLPQHVLLIREAQEASFALPKIAAAQALANRLLEREHRAAEQDFLSQHETKPARPLLLALTPFSYNFATIANCKGVVYYWMTRLMLMRLTHRFQIIVPSTGLHNS